MIEDLNELKEKLKKYQHSVSSTKLEQSNKTYEMNSDYVLAHVQLTDWQVKRAQL